MAITLKKTPRAELCLHELHRRVRGEVEEVIQRIVADPVKMTTEYTLGKRLHSGRCIAAGDTYYVEIQFSHSVGSELVLIERLTARSRLDSHH